MGRYRDTELAGSLAMVVVFGLAFVVGVVLSLLWLRGTNVSTMDDLGLAVVQRGELECVVRTDTGEVLDCQRRR